MEATDKIDWRAVRRRLPVGVSWRRLDIPARDDGAFHVNLQSVPDGLCALYGTRDEDCVSVTNGTVLGRPSRVVRPPAPAICEVVPYIRRILRSGRGHHRVLLRLEFGDRNGADGYDDVGRNVQASRREPDRLFARRFVKAIGLALVGAQEGK